MQTRDKTTVTRSPAPYFFNVLGTRCYPVTKAELNRKTYSNF